MKTFLGGTCNESTWRDELIPMLQIDFFNPVVDDWTPDCMDIELKERAAADFCLFTITPKMTGVYSIAEVVDDSNKRPDRTILVLLKKDNGLTFDKHQWKSLKAVAGMVESNGGIVFYNLRAAAKFMNEHKRVYSTLECCMFVNHIQNHLKPNQQVKCKICNETINEITSGLK